MNTTYEHTKGLAQQMSTTIRSAIALLLMLTLGSGSVWGQTSGYSGVYYIKSASTCKSPSGEYYLCPTEDWAFFHATDNVNSTNSGALLTRFDISPDETVKTPAYNNGVYVVRADGGKFQKKLFIK